MKSKGRLIQLHFIVFRFRFLHKAAANKFCKFVLLKAITAPFSESKEMRPVIKDLISLLSSTWLFDSMPLLSGPPSGHDELCKSFGGTFENHKEHQRDLSESHSRLICPVSCFQMGQRKKGTREATVLHPVDENNFSSSGK